MQTQQPQKNTESDTAKRVGAPIGWQKYVEDTRLGNVELSNALSHASREPNRHERRNLDRLARKYGMKGMAALYYWRQENGK
jgi:hypothetical protein